MNHQLVRGVILGSTIGSLLLLAGWTVRDRMPDTPPQCRDSFRRIAPQDEGMSCPYPSQVAQFVDMGGKLALFCQCHPAPQRSGVTELL